MKDFLIILALKIDVFDMKKLIFEYNNMMIFKKYNLSKIIKLN